MAIPASVWRLLVIGLVFHLVYIGTVFDCYFTSPVVHGMKQHSLKTAEAKRLVLIVGDGLRADLLLAKNGFSMIPGSPEIVAPYLRSIIETRGAFGISHTRVPTESRPGHVALIGGMYEDVSAVTKGWKTNPVDFDSVFNQSSTTFSFGSPDILPMFARGATPGKVEMWCYDEHEEDFTKDATALDVWVIENLRVLFQNATTDPQLDARLRGEKTVFFLHLLGLDTTGHSYRPHSIEYMVNIQFVDVIVKQTEELLRNFYGDEETAFVFTADHGMSRIGNHGDGDPDNTRTPLIVWGKGVRGPLPDTQPSSHDEYSKPWDLSHLVRRDVEQADVSVLMSSLIGVNWPVNSVGVLPDVDPTKPGYLLPKEGEKTQAEAALVNAQVILEQYRIKHDQKKRHSLFYKQYPFFAAWEDRESVPGEGVLADIEVLIEQKNYNAARLRAKDLIEHTLEGLRYLQTYDRTMIRGIVIVAYLGWIAFGAVSVLLPSANAPTRRLPLHIPTAAILVGFWSLFAKQRSPWSFYIYIVFPCYFWDQVLARATGPFLRYVWRCGFKSLIGHVFRGALVVVALQAMVAGYTHRSIWSASFAVIGIVWPVLVWPREVLVKERKLAIRWALACLATAVFPLLDVHQEENPPMIITGAVAIYIVGLSGLLAMVHYDYKDADRFRQILSYQLSGIGLNILFVTFIVRDLQLKHPVPRYLRFLGWCSFLGSIIAPFVFHVPVSNPHGRAVSFFIGLGVCFIWLTINSEGLFYAAYTVTLALWIEVETALRAHSEGKTEKVPEKDEDGKDSSASSGDTVDKPAEDKKATKKDEEEVKANTAPKDLSAYRPRADNLRIAVFFLFFVQVAFFGTGNVASISSFYLEPVYRLVPIFSPFLMAALLILKIVTPYVTLATTFSILNARLDLPPFSLVLLALTLTDIMTITFFLNVSDTGSWLEIGQTISFFCISSLLLVWSAALCALGEHLMAGQPRGLQGMPRPPPSKDWDPEWRTRLEEEIARARATAAANANANAAAATGLQGGAAGQYGAYGAYGGELAGQYGAGEGRAGRRRRTGAVDPSVFTASGSGAGAGAGVGASSSAGPAYGGPGAFAGQYAGGDQFNGGPMGELGTAAPAGAYAPIPPANEGRPSEVRTGTKRRRR
ncbi:Phosphatidylinositolglycan class N-domain-containing protein [Trametes polyzona]|nr:Phosphatidylinositolglycan class N-domain-containing protein [Trametes polyzona]